MDATAAEDGAGSRPGADAPAKPRRTAERDDPPKKPRVRDVVAEGVYIAAAATRLALKNRILVETLGSGDDFDADHFALEARETLLTLATEAEAEAERVRIEQRSAWRRFDDSDGTHDYRSRDVGNLRRRRRQAKRTAKALRERAEDPEALAELVEAARDLAWGEVARNIDRTLRIEAARPDLEDDYHSMRDARMQALMIVDLQRLQVQQRRRVKAAAGEPPETTGPSDKLSTQEVLFRTASGVDPGELE